MDTWPPGISLNINIVRELRRLAVDGANARVLSASTNLSQNNMTVCRYFRQAFLLTIHESMDLYVDSQSGSGPPAIDIPPLSNHRSIWTDPLFQESEYKVWQETVGALAEALGLTENQLLERGRSTSYSSSADKTHAHTVFNFLDTASPWTVTYGRDTANYWQYQMTLPGDIKLHDPACPVCQLRHEPLIRVDLDAATKIANAYVESTHANGVVPEFRSRASSWECTHFEHGATHGEWKFVYRLPERQKNKESRFAVIFVDPISGDLIEHTPADTESFGSS